MMGDGPTQLTPFDLKLEFDCYGVLRDVLLMRDGEAVGKLDFVMSANFESTAQKTGVWTLGLDAFRVQVEHQTDDEPVRPVT